MRNCANCREGDCILHSEWTRDDELCECGKPADSFACKIRHLSIQHGWAKGDH